MTASAATSPPDKHEVAEGQLVVDQVVADALVDALVATAQHREPARCRELERPRPGRIDAPTGSSAAAAGADRRLSTVAKMGSGLRTIPGPPPNGRVVDAAVRVGGAITKVVEAQVEQPVRRARPMTLSAAEVVDQRREDGEDVDAHRGRRHAQSNRPVGRVDHQVVARVVDQERQRHQGIAVGDQQVARRVLLHGDDDASIGAVESRRGDAR